MGSIIYTEARTIEIILFGVLDSDTNNSVDEFYVNSIWENFFESVNLDY